MRKGAGALSNAELLAVLLRTGTGGKNVIEVAREVLKEGDSRLGSVADMSIDRLCRISGIGPGKAVAVAAAFELGRRVEGEASAGDALQIDSPRKVYRLMLPKMRDMAMRNAGCCF